MTELSKVILVVDDDEFQRDVLGLQLAELGHVDVLYADCGTQALELFDLHKQRISLIISDLHMPDMDGLVLMRHLAERNTQAAFVLISSVSNEILNSAAGLASAHGLQLLGVLPKPNATKSLSAVLSKLPTLRQRNAADKHAYLTAKRLKAALDAGEFVAWYQPKVGLHSGKACGVEALARWSSVEGSMIGPDQFVPALEDAGLVDELFFAIMGQVVADMVRWRAEGIYIKAAINLSMDTTLNLEMPEQLRRVVAASGLQPSDFIIEVTESRLMANRSLAMETLTRLSMMGFTLSIDDFGTGYSSLVQLVDLPFNELKVDGGFVRRASDEAKAETIVRMAALLGNSLGMRVIAEGVETDEQLAFVRECGCDEGQGYFFARPMPFDSCTQWLGESTKRT